MSFTHHYFSHGCYINNVSIAVPSSLLLVSFIAICNLLAISNRTLYSVYECRLFLVVSSFYVVFLLKPHFHSFRGPITQFCRGDAILVTFLRNSLAEPVPLQVYNWLNPEFPFSYTGTHFKVKELSLSHYLSIARERIVGSIPFPIVLAVCAMQIVSFKIWTEGGHFLGR